MKLALCLALICAPAPAFAVPVTVVVVGPDKKPLPDAHLDVFDRVDGKTKAASREIPGSDGRFSFNWNGKFAAPTAAPGAATALASIVLVRAQAPGLATKITLVDKNAAVIELSARRAWGGLILDQNQKPIAGARVATSAFFTPTWETETRTDEAGRWQLDDLPAQGNLSLKVSAPNYIAADYALNLDNAEAPPLFLKPGATIRGQIVTPDGKPIDNAPVVVGYEYQNVMRTDKDGRFELNGVAPGEITLQSNDPFNRNLGENAKDVGYVVPDFEKVSVKGGQTIDIGQWKAVAGILITARIVDDETGKPMRDTYLSISADNNTSALADETGVAHVRVVPEKNPFGNEMGNVNAPGHIGAKVPRRALKAGVGALDLGIIRLKRGSVVSGKIRVQGETPQINAGLPLLALQSDGETSYIRFWGGANTFQTEALKPGNYKVSVQDWRGTNNKDWQLISPATLTIPALDAAKSPAIEVVVKRLKTRAAPQNLKEVRGQILDENGQDIGGAALHLKLMAGDGYREIDAVSSNDGKWSRNTDFAAEKVEVASIERPGYVRVGAATSQIKDGVAVVGGVAMKRLGGVFAGRIVDAEGKGAAGAWVAVAEIDNYPLAQTDANGQFELRDLPLDEFTLLAANAEGFARQGAESKAKNLEIQLKPNAKFERETAIKDALAGDFEWWRIADLWDYIGSERMGELAKRGGENGAWSRTRYALELAQREPKNFGARQNELTQDLDDEQKAEIEAAWNWGRAQSPDEAEKFALNSWVDAQKSVKRSIDAANVLQLLRVAAVAHRLKREDADDLSDYAAAIAAQLKVDGNVAEGWGDPLAKSGYEAAQSFAEGMKPIPEFKLWWTAAGDIAEMGDIAGAQKAVARMEELAATPDWIELSARESWNNPTYQIDQVRGQIARALAKTEPVVAQKLAASIEEQSNRTETSLSVADRALQIGDAKVAEAALRVAMQLNIGNPENYALAASLAQEVSPQLGTDLWAEAYLHAVPTEKRDASQGTFWPSVSMWAFYHARMDKGQSRVLIEREWNWRLPAAAKAGEDKEVDENDVASIGDLIMAMGVVDPARALEMRAEAARKVKSLANKANVGLAAALIANDAQRARFGLDSHLF